MKVMIHSRCGGEIIQEDQEGSSFHCSKCNQQGTSIQFSGDEVVLYPIGKYSPTSEQTLNKKEDFRKGPSGGYAE